MGVYAELGVSKLGLSFSANAPSGTTASTGPTVAADPVSGGGLAVGVTAGIDFDYERKTRFALEYGYDSVGYGGGGSGKLQTGGGRLDFNLASFSNDLQLRGVAAFGFGTGKSSLRASDGTLIERTDGNDFGAYAGLGVTYFVGTHIIVHASVGPKFVTQQTAGGGVSGVGVGAKVGVSFSFGNTIPDTIFYEPLGNRDITPVITAGAERLGCRSKSGRDRHDTFAYVFATCDGREIKYIQGATGIGVICPHTWEADCRALNTRILESAIKTIDGPTKGAPASSVTPPAASSATPPASSAAPPASSAVPER
jgi:hypothetical protein